MRGLIGLVAVGAVIGGIAAIGQVARHARGAAERPSELKDAQASFDLKSYNRAIDQAQAVLRGHPAADQAAGARRLIGLSQVALRRYPEGLATLDGLVKADPRFDRDAAVQEALAQAVENVFNSDIPRVRSQFDKAIALEQARGDRDTQVRLVFELAQYLEGHSYQLFLAEYPGHYQQRILAGTALILATYDRILALNPPEDVQVRALHAKAQWLLRSYFGPVPRAQWPAGVATDADLAHPLEQAIHYLEEIVRRFPNNPAAPQAQLEVAEVDNQRLQRYVDAVKEYQVVVERYPGTGQARQAVNQIAAIKAPQVSIGVSGVSPPGRQPKLGWQTRNVKQVQLRAYAVDLFDLLRRVGQLVGPSLRAYPLAGRAPAAQWTVDVPDRGAYEFHAGHQDPQANLWAVPLETSGAYLVTAAGQNPQGQRVEAVSLVLISRLGLAAKTGKQRGVFFAVDSDTGAPRAGTEILVQRLVQYVVRNGRSEPEYAYNQGKVPDSGLYRFDFPQTNPAGSNPVYWNRQLVAIARHGSDYALTSNAYFWHWWGYNEDYRIYGYTDRPVYRPGQTVHFKEVVRRYQQGVYTNAPNLAVQVQVIDARGQTIDSQSHVTDADGTLSGSLILTERPPLGMYRIQLVLPGQRPYGSDAGNSFRVEEYKKPEFAVTVTTAEKTYKIGQAIRVKLHGEYYFGGPVANARVHYTVHRQAYYPEFHPPHPYPWYYTGTDMGNAGWFGRSRGFYPGIVRPFRRDLVRQGDLTTDAQGDALITIQTRPFDQLPQTDLEYVFDVQMVDASRRQVHASQAVRVTHQAFYVDLEPEQHLYQPRDRVKIDVTAKNPNNQPVGFEGQAIISFVTQREQRDETGKVTKPETLEELRRLPVTVTADGRGRVEFTAGRQGYFKVVVETADPYGGKVRGHAYVWIADRPERFAHYAYRDLELVPDRTTHQAGDTMRLMINSSHSEAYVLLTVEADEIYEQRIVYVPKNSVTVELPVGEQDQPNVWVKAELFRDRKVFRDQVELIVPPVQKFLTVTIRSPRRTYRPRESAEVEVVTTDHAGRPVSADTSLAAVDASLFEIQDQLRSDIRQFFYGAKRQLLVQSTSSFEYQNQGWGIGRNFDTDGFPEGGAALGGMARGMAAARAPMAMMAKDAAPAERQEARRAVVDRSAFRAREKKAEAEPAFKQAEVRHEFADAIYWAANIHTDGRGRARVKVRFPDTLTTWRLTAIAVTPETRVGEVKHEVITRKDLIVRLEAPRFFVERDRVVLSAIVHNFLKARKRVRVALGVTDALELLGRPAVASAGAPPAEAAEPTGGGQAAAQTDVEVPSGGEARVNVWARARHPGKVTIQASALTDEESDAMRMDYPVLEYGTQKLLASNGIIFGHEGQTTPPATVQVAIPDRIRAGSQRMTITVSPSIAGVMLQAVPYLIDYPYGCTEQTMSRFAPAVLVQSTLHDLGIRLEDLQKIPATDAVMRRRLAQFRASPVYSSAELAKVIQAGLDRLADFQHPDGSWGWWKTDTGNPYMTAYVVQGLALARKAGVKLPDGMLPRGAQYLAQRIANPEPVAPYAWLQAESGNVRLFMLYALAQADPAQVTAAPRVRAQLRDLFAGRDALNDYARGLLALTLWATNQKEEAHIVLDNLADRARIDRDTDTASWGDATGWYYWYQSGTEATSYALKALLAIEPRSPLIPQAVNWLVRQRRGTRWFSTKDTATVLYALADYLRATGELDPDLTITARVGQRVSRTWHITRANLFTFDDRLTLGPDLLGTGRQTVTLTRAGRGNLYWGVYTEFFSREDRLTAAGNELFVRRHYFKLTPRTVTETRSVYDPARGKPVAERYTRITYDRAPLADGQAVRSGDLIDVDLEITARNNFEYLLFEDPKPAGCEPTEQHSGPAFAGGLGGHMELRDEKVAFFTTYLNQGTHRLSYRLRAEVPGAFHALPAHAECMYAPFVKGNSDGDIVKVIEAAVAGP